MAKRRNYKFTNRNFSLIGIMSAIWGMISLLALIMTVVMSFLQGGTANLRYGLTCIVALLFSGAGLWLGIKARREPEKFYLYADMGIVLNAICLLFLVAIVVLGIVFPR